MSKVVKRAVKVAFAPARVTAKIVKKAWKNKFIRAALIATAAVFTGGMAASLAAGSGIGASLAAGGQAITSAVSSLGSAITGGAKAAAGSAAGKSIIGSLLSKEVIGAGLTLAGSAMKGRAEQKAREMEIATAERWRNEDIARRNAAQNVSGIQIGDPYARSQIIRSALADPTSTVVDPQPKQLQQMPTYLNQQVAMQGWPNYAPFQSVRNVMEDEEEPWRV